MPDDLGVPGAADHHAWVRGASRSTLPVPTDTTWLVWVLPQMFDAVEGQRSSQDG